MSHTYPFAGYNEFRTCCDFVNIIYVIDEVTDEQTEEDARKTGAVYLNALRHVDWDDDSALAKMTKE